MGPFVLEGHGRYWSFDEDAFKDADMRPWQDIGKKAVDTYYGQVEYVPPHSPFLRRLLEEAKLVGPMDGRQTWIPGEPSPLMAMLVSGLAGAGIGYGLGTLGSFLLPSTWRRHNLRRTGAILGALIGMSPGLFVGLSNVLSGRSFNDNQAMLNQHGTPIMRHPGVEIEVGPIDRSLEIKQSSVSPWIEMSCALPDNWDRFAKEAQTGSLTGLDNIPPLSPVEFNMTVTGDPRVANRLSPDMRAAATGVVTAAASLPGKKTNLVTPMDMARVAAGMGSGYVSGMLVGKALGALMGMPPETQEKLKQVGLWSGVIANVIPAIFGG
jgi:hypothetical protein